MAITKQDVALSGKLAKMTVTEQEADIYQEQLEALFGWVKELAAVNTDHVKLTNVNLAAHLRKDTPAEDAALAAQLRAVFAQQEKDCAKVKKVL